MLAGHYTSSFVAKAVSPRTPLWVLLLAAQFVDVLWVLAILGGVEHARLTPGLPSNPLDLYDMPWTHSLVATLGWAALAWAIALRLLRLASKEALLVAAVVVSHWFADLVVHRPDLTIAGGSAKIGLALWNFPFLAWALEVALLAASVAMAMRTNATSPAGRRAWLWLGGGLVALQTAATAGPLPPSLPVLVSSSLAIYILIAAAGARVDAASRPA